LEQPGEVWQAQIRVNGVLHALGRFDKEEAAARIYDEHALRLGRPVNFPTVAGQAKALKPGSSKYRGVTLEKGSKGASGKWKARMGILGKIVPLGNFETEEVRTDHFPFCFLWPRCELKRPVSFIF